MSLTPEHKKPQLPWQDVAIFAAVLCFLGYSVYAFLSFQRAQAKRASTAAEVADLQSPANDRRPASQSAQSAGSTGILHAPCLISSNPLSFESQARLLQIHAPLCAAGKEISAKWRAANETSGEEIIVFVNGKEKSLSTSYFSLKDGSNQIVFTEELGAGKSRAAKIQVIRKVD